MQTFVMLTRLVRGRQEADLSAVGLEQDVMRRVKTDCPNVTWTASYALLGGADYLDIFQAPDCEAALKVALIVRSSGHATTETWPATDWERFKVLVQSVA